MIVAAIVFVAMLGMDICETIKIDALSNQRFSKWRRRGYASLAEVGHDEGSAFAVGVGGASVYHYGVSLVSAMILLALGAAAVLGTILGDMAEGWLTNRGRIE